MLTTTENQDGATTAAEAAAPEASVRHYVNGTQHKGEKRRPAGRPLPPAPPSAGVAPALALFSYENPDNAVGECAARLAGCLAGRDFAVHLFCRQGCEPSVAGVSLHALGDCPGEDLAGQVSEFTHRACNAFLKQFDSAAAPVALLGFEWSSVQALSILRGIENLDALLYLHSLERQRSDVSSDEARRIEQVELVGLREARTILVQDPATAEVAKFWEPQCADRLVTARPRFASHLFTGVTDPGIIKARYDVGPVDPTILFVGDLDERYGPDVVLKAMPAVLRNHPQARLVVVGDGSLYWPLRVYARYLLLEHAVRLVGHVADEPLYELVQAADVIVVASREATPWWPILAAWAAGRPVVATHSAAPGLLEHEQDAVLCYASENSCVWGIERILYDVELRRSLAEHGRAKLDERFGWSALAQQVQELAGARQTC